MTKLRSNLRELLVESYNSVVQSATFREWVLMESENDPNFFNLAFDADFEQDFDASLSDDQRTEWEEYVNNLEELTYNVVFNDESSSNDKGFELSMDEALDWIKANESDETSYFNAYKGGTVSIVCNETGRTVFSQNIR